MRFDIVKIEENHFGAPPSAAALRRAALWSVFASGIQPARILRPSMAAPSVRPGAEEMAGGMLVDWNDGMEL